MSRVLPTARTVGSGPGTDPADGEDGDRREVPFFTVVRAGMSSPSPRRARLVSLVLLALGGIALGAANVQDPQRPLVLRVVALETLEAGGPLLRVIHGMLAEDEAVAPQVAQNAIVLSARVDTVQRVRAFVRQADHDPRELLGRAEQLAAEIERMNEVGVRWPAHRRAAAVLLDRLEMASAGLAKHLRGIERAGAKRDGQ